MKKRFTDDDLRAELECAIVRVGSLRAVAREAGVSPTFLSLVRHGQSLPGPTLAAYLGFKDDGLRWVKHG